MKNAVCLLSAVPVRSGPSHGEEMETQLIFGERAILLEEQPKWSFVKLIEDGYQGWIYNSSICEIPEDIAAKMAETRHEILGSLILQVMSNLDNRPFYISAGSLLYDYDSNTGTFNAGGQIFTCLQEPVFYQGDKLRDNIVSVAQNFMNIPYLWGGRNPFGMDCSGLTQTLYKIFGVRLPRNSRHQVSLGEKITRIEEARAGDLAFFENESGRIIHTGVLTGNGRIIHASGMVRTDRIDQRGIYNCNSKSYTHRLNIVKTLPD